MLVLEGLLLSPDGDPAPDVVVVSSAGGTTRTDVTGHYRLEVARAGTVTVLPEARRR